MKVRSVLLLLAGILFSTTMAESNPIAGDSPLTPYGKIAWKESVVPVRPGVPGKSPFWNEKARQFIYAPAFDYKIIDGAVLYKYLLVSAVNSQTFTLTDKVPYAPLSEVWASVPVGYFDLTVTGLSADGKELGLSGKGKYYRASPFNGVYHKPELPYDSSAMLALSLLMEKDYVTYWLTHKIPDPGYLNYRFPAKIYSALVIGAITYARLKPGTGEAARASELARIVADYMLDIRFKEGTPWEFFVPTYYGPHSEKAEKDHLKPINNFSIMGVDAGHAFLDLYDFTGDGKYLQAAVKISDTYLKRQLDNGSWYQFVNHETGKPTAANIVIPTTVINYFDRLRNDYKVKGLEKPTARALAWIMDNPVRTFDWQGQFEDVFARPPYQNLSREQACDLAIYLFRNKKDLELAEELVRFSEDQFVIWEQPLPIVYQEPRKGGRSENWITPSVQEQTIFWMPVGRSAGIMMLTFREAWVATQNEMYLAKARSIANAFTVVQKANKGDYPTFFTQYPMNKWLNSTVYPAKLMMEFKKDLDRIGN